MDDEKKTPPGTKGSLATRDGLSALWQSAVGQLDEIRDAIVRGSQAGKAKIDVQLLKRQRERLLGQIGEALLEDVARGAAALPASCEELQRRVVDIEAQIAAAEDEASKALQRP